MRQTGQLGPQEFWARIDEGDAQVRAAVGVLPLFGVDGWTGPRMTGDWQWRDSELISAALAHGDRQGDGAYVHVQTTSRDPMEVAVGRRMRARPHPIDKDGFRALRDDLAADPGIPVVVNVEDEPCEFLQWSDEAGWVAAARYGDVGIVIEASAAADIAQVRLVRVTDVEPYIAGRRARLRRVRRVRGEDV